MKAVGNHQTLSIMAVRSRPVAADWFAIIAIIRTASIDSIADAQYFKDNDSGSALVVIRLEVLSLIVMHVLHNFYL